jgi:uncharacterized protein (TIGR03067 family)
MTLFISCLFVGVTALPAPEKPADAPPKGDLAALQGVWKVESLEVDGKEAEFPQNPLRWVIKGNKVFYGGAELAVLKPDDSTSPKLLDLEFVKLKRVLEGIYSVEGDTLKLCVNRQSEGAKERPQTFATEGKSDLRLLVFKRVKDAKGDEAEEGAGFVGIQIRRNDDDTEVSVAAALEGSPAEKAGLKKDDVLVKVGGEAATTLQGVIKAVRAVKPGSELTLRIKRDGKEQDVTVKVGVVPFFLLD